MHVRYIVAAVMSACLLALGACDSGSRDSNNPVFRSGIISPTRYGKPVKVKIGDYRAAIPANCFMPYPPPEGPRERGHIVTSDALLFMLLPGLDCATNSNKGLFSVVGLYRPELAVFATKIGPSIVPPVALASILQLQYSHPHYPDRIHFTFVKEEPDERIYSAIINSVYSEDSRMVYLSKHDLSFTGCTRFGKPKQANTRQLISNCTLFMFRGRLLLQVNYAGGYEDRHLQIKEAVLGKFDEFARSTHQGPI
jgi:hypothetical protein